MCGIAGKLYFERARPVERPILDAMNRVLAHRGPDDEGISRTAPSASRTVVSASSISVRPAISR